MGFLDWLRRGAKTADPGVGLTNTVKLDDTWVVYHRGDGSLEELAWPDLQIVQIRVSALASEEGEPRGEPEPDIPRRAKPGGPRALHWILVGKASHCEIPFETRGCDELYERLKKLEDFNDGAVREAREADPPAELLCWIRGAA
jgi:hypothetical protein